MDLPLSQKIMPWGNQLLGFSKFYIHAYGSELTCLAEILGTTPDIVNEKLKAVNGFSADSTGELTLIIWEKIVSAFPEWSARFIIPYHNDAVVEALSKGYGIIVQTGTGEPFHAVRYIGQGKCHDPFTGTEKPTLDFPDVKAFIIVIKTEEQKSPELTDLTAQSVALLGTSVTLANLPLHEKNAIIAQAENALIEIKKLLGV